MGFLGLFALELVNTFDIFAEGFELSVDLDVIIGFCVTVSVSVFGLAPVGTVMALEERVSIGERNDGTVDGLFFLSNMGFFRTPFWEPTPFSSRLGLLLPFLRLVGSG